MYTAIVLNKEDRSRLKQRMAPNIPEGWEVICHHVTLNMGNITDGPTPKSLLGEKVEFVVDAEASNDKVLAVRVLKMYNDDVYCVNKTPHVTVAVNRKDGGRPVMSNQLEGWKRIYPEIFSGIVTEVG